MSMWQRATMEWLKEDEEFTVSPKDEPEEIIHKGRDYPVVATSLGRRIMFYSVFRQIACLLAEADFERAMRFVVRKAEDGKLKAFRIDEELKEEYIETSPEDVK